MIHFHNGDVVVAAARRAEIPGEHLAFRESLVTGTVQPGADWLETRARTLAEAFGQDLLRVRTELFEQEQALDAATGEVVLWFEHDLFCLTHFLYLLQRLRTPQLTYVWHPTPLSELEDRELHLLFDSRTAVTPAMLAVAREAWEAYTSPDPTRLNAWLYRDVPEFPFLREALTLHASRFPSTTNGLGTIEQRALARIAGGVTDFATLFPLLDSDPPRFGFGDAEVLRQLRAFAWRAVPLITLHEATEGTPKVMFAITPAGENVLLGEVDDTAINDPDLRLGGAHVTKENLWRWDESQRKIVPSLRAVS